MWKYSLSSPSACKKNRRNAEANRHPPAFLKRFYLLIFRKRGREGERKGEKHWCEREISIGHLSYAPQPWTEPATQASALAVNWTSDLSLCEVVSNQLSHTSQGHPPACYSFHRTVQSKHLRTRMLYSDYLNTLNIIIIKYYLFTHPQNSIECFLCIKHLTFLPYVVLDQPFCKTSKAGKTSVKGSRQ